MAQTPGDLPAEEASAADAAPASGATPAAGASAGSVPYPIPVDEEQRLRELERLGVDTLDGDSSFERILDIASSIFGTPIVLISLVERNRQRFLGRRGLEVRETPREVAFCAHAIAGEGVLVVPDALEDQRFRQNPLVLGDPHIRFYAGAPLISPAGHKLGTLCLVDRQPRSLEPVQQRQLQWLAELVMRELELRRHALLDPVTGLSSRATFLQIGDREFSKARRETTSLALFCFDIDHFRRINDRWGHHVGDEILVNLRHLLDGLRREQDFAGRIGDGEFALLLPAIDDARALALAERLRREVGQLPGPHRHSDVALHISGGLTAMGPADRSFTDVLRRSDRALQLAKSNGRDQIACLFDGR